MTMIASPVISHIASIDKIVKTLSRVFQWHRCPIGESANNSLVPKRAPRINRPSMYVMFLVENMLTCSNVLPCATHQRVGRIVDRIQIF